MGIKTKHFQYNGVDDFDNAIDSQINDYLTDEGVGADQLIDIKYAAHSSQGVSIYSAMVIYEEE